MLASLSAPCLARSTATPDLARDPNRPQYHYLPPANWMNDPNAPVYHKGEYHLYYQYNPKAAKWDTMHWGHASSPDLLHWKQLPIALAPTPGGPDKDGCFTGCMVIDSGTPTIMYTGVNPEVQCIATSEDLASWNKFKGNPVIAVPPPGIDTPGFRDPQVWREGDDWLLLIGAGFRGVGGTVLLYKSSNLREWTYLKPFMRGAIHPVAGSKDPVAIGEMWECPDFFPVGDKWLFYVSTEGKVLYWLGTWKDRTFQPESNGVLVYGAGYAPKSCEASGGRRIIWSWLREQRSQEEQLKAGWSGVMSLAVVPSLSKEGTLLLKPAAEYRQLRGQRSNGPLPDDCCELRVTVADGQPFQLMRGSRELVTFDPQKKILRAGPSEAPVPAGPLNLSIFLDGSVIEVFANDRVYLTGRSYGPIEPLRIPLEVEFMQAYPLRPASKDRLTT